MINSPKNSSFMKFQNRQLILNIIRKKLVSRAELARKTGLTRAAISIITAELIDRNIILEIGTAESDYGRKPVLLDINPESFYTLGLDISRSHHTIGLVNMKGIVIGKKQIKLSNHKNPYEAIKLIVKEIKRILEERRVPEDKILGLGVSTPGPLDVESGTILNPPNFEMWKNINIVKLFKEEFDFDVFLENNSVALALAEKNFGSGRTIHSFILLVIDTGIGAGIIINDELYRGIGGFGGEVGHTSINVDGKYCSCGNRGCLEVYASIPAILEDAHEVNKSITSWNYIVEGAITGDEICTQLMDREARYLACGIVNVMNILELEAVVLTGYVKYKPELLMDKVNNWVNKTSITRDIRRTNILITSISENPEIISAATIVIDRFFSGVINPIS